MQFIALSDKPNTAAYFGGKRKPSEADIGQEKWFLPAQSWEKKFIIKSFQLLPLKMPKIAL